MKRLLTSRTIHTLDDLRKFLDADCDDDEVRYVSIDGDPVEIRLIEETLSDGSKVENIEVSPHI